jgi:hypothetical protein
MPAAQCRVSRGLRINPIVSVENTAFTFVGTASAMPTGLRFSTTDVGFCKWFAFLESG